MGAGILIGSKAGKLVLGGLLAAVLLLSAVGATEARAASGECPNSFRVLHDDSIGKLKLPKGNYTITLLDKKKLTCTKAAHLFSRFLEDYDGNLPGKWRVKAKQAAFLKGNTGAGFTVKKGKPSGGGGGGGRHPDSGGKQCPDTFRVLHNDSIGELKFPAGSYYLTRLTTDSPSCARVTKLFAKFLQDYEGNVPGWRINVSKAQFTRKGSGGKGFRVKPA